MKRSTKWVLRILGGLIAIFVLTVGGAALYVAALWDKPINRPAPQMAAIRDSTSTARGEYLFKYTLLCWQCHAPAPNDANALPVGGNQFDLRNTGPGFGMFYGTNLTPDPATGLGNWTDGEIVQAIREGIGKNRNVLFPIMANEWYKDISDEDVLALVAYLRSLQPVNHPVPQRQPSFVTKALITFNLIKPVPVITRMVVAPSPGPTPEYGRYLAMNISGCAECHTPRSMDDGHFYMDSLFAGSSIAYGEPEGDPVRAYALNITPHRETGIGPWTEQQFMIAMTAGLRPNGTVLAPQMPYAYYKFWKSDDLRALYAYVKTIAPVQRHVAARTYAPAVDQARGAERGKLLFESHCQVCHGRNGAGAAPTTISLADVAASTPDQELKDLIVSGMLESKMPPFGRTLSADQLNDVVAFIRSWQPAR